MQLGVKAGEWSLLLSTSTAGVDLLLRAWLALPNRGIYPHPPTPTLVLLRFLESLRQCLPALRLSQLQV